MEAELTSHMYRYSVMSSLPSNFPNSLSKYSDENMMDAGNLAIVFGPTLLPTPDTLDQVACQAHVNEVVKTVILHHDNIFPDTKELPGPVYETCMTGDQYWWGPSPSTAPGTIMFIQLEYCYHGTDS